MKKLFSFIFLMLLNLHLFAVVKKPYNGKYIFAEFNNPSYYHGLMELGYGYFKTFKSGYEFSAYLKLLDNNVYEPSNSRRFGLKCNKFYRNTCGKKSSSLGYKIGGSYMYNSIYFSSETYSKAFMDYEINNTTFKSYLLSANIEAFYNLRLTGRLYLELGFGLTNGLEYIKYKGGEIQRFHQAAPGGPSWHGKGPGYYYRTGFTGHIRLLGAFGKNKRIRKS